VNFQRIHSLPGLRGPTPPRDSGTRTIPPLHVVSDDEVVGRAGFVEAARQVMEAGGADLAFHLRAPRATGRALFETAVRLIASAAEAGASVFVNDRVDVARAAGAHGVQVGARGLPAEDARWMVGTERLVGLSVHSVDEARAALSGAPDFLLVGTVWETPSHPDRPGAGVGLVRAVAALGLPAIAIGGVTPARVAEARGAGAAGIAVLRGVWDAPDPAAAVREFLSAWKESS